MTLKITDNEFPQFAEFMTCLLSKSWNTRFWNRNC